MATTTSQAGPPLEQSYWVQECADTDSWHDFEEHDTVEEAQTSARNLTTEETGRFRAVIRETRDTVLPG